MVFKSELTHKTRAKCLLYNYNLEQLRFITKDSYKTTQDLFGPMLIRKCVDCRLIIKLKCDVMQTVKILF